MTNDPRIEPSHALDEIAMALFDLFDEEMERRGLTMKHLVVMMAVRDDIEPNGSMAAHVQGQTQLTDAEERFIEMMGVATGHLNQAIKDRGLEVVIHPVGDKRFPV